MAGAIDKESKMKFIACAVTLVFMLWGAPVLAGPCPDADSDGVCDDHDNCIPPLPAGATASTMANPNQDDTDSDFCGNVCDPDYDQDGTVGFGDVFLSVDPSFLNVVPLHDHTEPVGGTSVIGFGDWFVLIDYLFSDAGPSGTTPNTVACPFP